MNSFPIFRPLILLLPALIAVSQLLPAQVPAHAPFLNPGLPAEVRAGDLLQRMTLEEKFFQLYMIPGDLSIGREKLKYGLFGFQDPKTDDAPKAHAQLIPAGTGRSASATARKFNEVQAFFQDSTRLGIPVIFFEEALHGLSLKGATSFPQSIALAATFDVHLMKRISVAVARECRSRGIRQVLSPVVNIATDPRWGRTEETYGEDPLLASEMGTAFVSGFERAGVVTTPKHFIANSGDGGRDSYPILAGERALRSIHLPPFEACIRSGGSRSVMTSYNSHDGIPCTSNERLLKEILKSEWNFPGYVISDAGAVGGANVLHFTAADYCDATAQAINGGLDVIFQTSYDHYPLFYEAFRKGLVEPERLDDAVRRVLAVKFSLGLFEDPYVDPDLADTVNGCREHRELALEAAQKSIVLLKNESATLPLETAGLNIAVFGPDAVEGRLGGYSGPGNHVVTILDGIRQTAGPSADVNYARGCERVVTDYAPIPSSCLFHMVNGHPEPGLSGEYFDHANFTGTPVFTRTDPQIRFQWTLFGPDPQRLPNDFYAVRWTGLIRVPETGTFNIGVDGNDGYRLYLDGKLVIDRSIQRTRRLTTVPFRVEKDRLYALLIEYAEPRGNSWFSLVSNYGIPDTLEKQLAQAVALASQSDVCIVTAGIEEGEFRDRSSLALPGNQEELIRRLSVTGKPVVVILTGGSAITMNDWIDQADAILQAWYPGECGGRAVAEILFGKISPSGRLPITFPVSEGQLPLVYNHLPTGRGDDYMDLTGQPLFPFGFGLSYTTIEYKKLTLSDTVLIAGDTVNATVILQNSGRADGEEVVQMYLRDRVSSVARPVIELIAFQRVPLKKGEAKKVEFQITPRMLAMLDKNLQSVTEPGDFDILVGASSRDIRLKGVLRFSGR